MALTDNQLTDVFTKQFGRAPLADESTKFKGEDLTKLSNMPDPTFALVPGANGAPSTVYNKSTGKGFGSKEEFAQAVGANPSNLDWSKYKFDTTYQPGQQPYTEKDPALTPFDAQKAYTDSYTQLDGDGAKKEYTTVKSKLDNIDGQIEGLKQQKLAEAQRSGGIVSEAQISQEVAREHQDLILQRNGITRQMQTAQSNYNSVLTQAKTQAQLAETTYKDKIAAFNATTRSQFNLANLAQRTDYQNKTLDAKDAALQEKAAKDGVDLGASSGLSVAATRYNDPNISIDPTPAADGGSFLKFSTMEAGKSAMGTLLTSDTYSSLSISAALKKWGTNVGVAESILKGQVNLSAKVGSLSTEQVRKVTDAITRAEGSDKPGSRGARNNNPGNIKVPKGSASNSDAKTIAAAIISGKQPPDLKGLYAKSAAVRAELAKQGYDLTKAQEDWAATQKFIATANSSTQLRLRQAISFTAESLPIVDDLNTKAEAALHRYGITNFAKVQKSAAMQGVYGQEVKSAFTQLDSQIGDLVSELATVYKGGNSSTNDGLAQAGKMLSSNWDYQTLKDNVELVKRNLAIRKASITSVGVAGVSDNPYAPASSSTDSSSGGSVPDLSSFIKN